MKPIQTLHASYIADRRARVLSRHLEQLLPAATRVLDVGSGDGLIAHLLLAQRQDLEIECVDVLVRDETHVPVKQFDGNRIPFGDDQFDVVMLIDVLHHTEGPTRLVSEAKRVARRNLVIKDHTASGFLARPTLRLMDAVGNARHGVALPHNYWTSSMWRDCFEVLNLRVVEQRDNLGIYPTPLSWICDRSLHFMALLRTAS